MSPKIITDLHMHSDYSDGELDIRDLILHVKNQVAKETKEKKFMDLERTVISITDHDNLFGVETALRYGKEFNIEVVPGIEITSNFEGDGIHIIGYFHESDLGYVLSNKEISELLSKNIKIREEKIKRILSALREEKISNITMNDIRLIKPHNKFIGLPHIVSAIKIKNKLSDDEIDDTFAMIKRIEKSTRNENYESYDNMEKVVETLRKANILPVIAHPLREDLRRIYTLINDFYKCGGLGIECFYPYEKFKTNSKNLRPYVIDINNFCLAKELLMLGGSDYHGKYFGDKRELFEVNIPDYIIDRLFERINDLRKGKIK